MIIPLEYVKLALQYHHWWCGAIGNKGVMCLATQKVCDKFFLFGGICERA